MRQTTINICKFSELDENAKDKAKTDYASLFGYMRQDEAIESLTKLAEYFDGKLQNYAVDFFDSSYSSADFYMPDDMPKKEIRRRLMNLGTYNRKTLKGHGDCALTGDCCDEDCIDGFRIAFIRNKQTDLEVLMQAAFKTWLKACQADAEYEYSDEQFEEHCEANNYEFYENGEFVTKN